MAFKVKSGGSWATATPWVKHAGTWKKPKVFVKQGGVWKTVHAGVITVALSPVSQDLSGSASSRTFSTTTASATGGTPSSYTWGILNASGGTWAFASQSGATATPQVSNVPTSSFASATVYCDMVIDGTTYRATADLSYSTGGFGGIGDP